eukprot:4200298-Heterocapsa_arctica.AAC.1
MSKVLGALFACSWLLALVPGGPGPSPRLGVRPPPLLVLVEVLLVPGPRSALDVALLGLGLCSPLSDCSGLVHQEGMGRIVLGQLLRQ